MITSKLLLLSVSVIAILVSSTMFVAIPAIPRASAQAQLPREQRNWEYINHDSLGTNFNPQTQINKDNVQHLELKWLFPIPSAASGSGLIGVTNAPEGSRIPPLVVDGVVYVMTDYRTLFALDAGTGKTIWTWKQIHNDTDYLKRVLSASPLGGHGWGHAIYYFEGRIWTSGFGCSILGIDALTGKLTYEITDLCVDVPTNVGVYKQAGSHPAVLYKKGNVLIYSMGGEGEGRASGRTFVAGFDFTTKKLLWRTFLQPPSSQCSGGYAGAPGAYKCTPLFPAERAAWNDWLVKNCARGWIGGIPACDVPEDILRNDWGDMSYFGRYTSSPAPPNSGLSNIWGEMTVDEETGLFYLGTSQPGGTDANATFRPGPNLFGNTIMALSATTGEIKWYYQSTPHDLWDVDCSWNTILGKIDNRKVLFKGCKNGHVHALDALTGKPIWVTEIPAVKFSEGYCNALCNNRDGKLAPVGKGRGPLNVDGKTYTNYMDPRSREDMSKGWDGYPSLASHWVTPFGSAALEADMAFDGERIYASIKNEPSWQQRPGGAARPFIPESNSTISALDARTGKVLWEYTMRTVAHRGGVFVSGGVAYWNGFDGILYGADALTGKILLQKLMGTTGLDTQPTIGATADGKMRLFLVFGGRGAPAIVPGALMVFGLPDKLPEPQVITKEIVREVPKEVIKEVIKEVPKEVIKEVIKEVPKEVIKEVPKEVIKEVTKTVTVETISPVSYAAIGVGVVLVVVAGVMMSRRKKA